MTFQLAAPVAIVGAGPIGLAAAAHLAERQVAFVLLEARDGPGSHVRSWAHIRTFSPWRHNLDSVAVRLLEKSGWSAPDPDGLPTGEELLSDYLEPLAALDQLAGSIRYGWQVTSIARRWADRSRERCRKDLPFVVRARSTDGIEHDLTVSAVIDASGTTGTPSPLGSAGLPARGEAAAASERRITCALPDVLGADRSLFAGRRVLVVGSGYSAATALLALDQLADQEPDTQVAWAIRSSSPGALYGDKEADILPARRLLGSGLRDAVACGRITLTTDVNITSMIPLPDGSIELGRPDAEPLVADIVVRATGYRPDLDILSEIQLDLDPALDCPRGMAKVIAPQSHICEIASLPGERQLTHPDPGVYILGAKSYGRASNFLMASGYEQVRLVAAALAGDIAEANPGVPSATTCAGSPEEAGPTYGSAATPATSACGSSSAGATSGACS